MFLYLYKKIMFINIYTYIYWPALALGQWDSMEDGV